VKARFISGPAGTFPPFWSKQFQMRHAQRGRQLENCNDGGVSLPLFQAADVLLAIAGYLSKLFLRQTIL
jgi:hypothetical protein